MTTAQQTSAEHNLVKTVQFLPLGEQAQLPVPFVRVTTCGLMTIEVVTEMISSDPPLARYLPLTPEQLHGRGTIPAFMLLKLLRVVVRFCTFRKKVLHFDWQAETPSDVFRKRSVAVIF